MISSFSRDRPGLGVHKAGQNQNNPEKHP